MTHRGPFQPLPFRDSVILLLLSLHSKAHRLGLCTCLAT